MDIKQPILNLSGAGPQLIVVGTALLVMLIDAAWRKGPKRLLGYLALVGLVAAIAMQVMPGVRTEGVFAGMLAADGLGGAFSAVLAVAAAISVLLAMDYLRREELECGEYYALILFATAGAMAMVTAADLVAVFIGLEILSISLYVLAGFARTDGASREAAIKYLLLGAFSSAFLLYGIAMLYGATGTTNLAAMATVLRKAGSVVSPLLWVGVGLVTVGLGFKLALVPFHTWAPDVYQGSPLPVTAYMSVVSKAAAFAALVRLLLVVWQPIVPLTGAILAILAVLTMTVGNVLAVAQDDAKRLLAYSSIAQAGYVLVALVAGSELGGAAALFYLAGYVFTNLGAFAVLTAWSRRGSSDLPLQDLAGLGFRKPWQAAALSFFLLSLTGIPITVGFVGKFYLFGAAVQGGWTWLAIVAVLNSVISAFYYLRLIVIMYMREAETPVEHKAPGWPLRLALGMCVVAVLALGVLPGPALTWAQRALAAILS